jgi:hypothetical protein
MAYQVVLRTQGAATSFVNTTNGVPIFLTAGQAVRFLSTYAPTSLFLTGGVKQAYTTTNANFPVFLTPSQATVFLTTVDTNSAKLLKLIIGTLEIATGYTFVNVPDATGDFDATTNPGGYNILPLPFNAARPYRENVALWTVYRIWNVYGNNTQSPDDQNEQYEVDYEYQLFIPTQTNADQEEEIIRGVYEIILIAAPYFNETDTGGTYLSESPSVETGYIVLGTDTNFSDVLIPGDYLYYINEADGDLFEIEEVLMNFNNTTLALAATAVNTPSQGVKLYGSNSQILTAVNSGGTVDAFTSNPYTPVIGNATDFTTNFAAGEFVYYVETATGDYKLMGSILQLISPLNVNLIDVTENVATAGEVLVSYNVASVPAINSKGVFDTNTVGTLLGIGTEFTLFTPGQTLYYQDATTGLLSVVTVIDSITNDTEIAFTGPLVNTPNPGDRLFASDELSITLNSSDGGTFSSLAPEATYYTLTGTGTTFTLFANSDFAYIVSGGLYNELGQISLIQTNESMVFYSPNDIPVTQGDFIVASSVQLNLIDIEGTLFDYGTQDYYNLEGDGTTFLTTAEPQQYLFYEDANGQFIKTGQIYQVFDDENVWLYDAPEGSPDNTTQLFTSYSLNTETASYADYRGLNNLYEIAKQSPGWFVTSAGLIVDEFLINCLTRLRYEFLQGIMCGRCDEGYLHTYSLYVGMLSAMEVGEWLLAVDFYNKLKVICAEQDGSSCGC